MGLPNISERLHYRLIPGEPTEPTSTIVLTSKDLYYVDIRLLKDKLAEEQGRETNSFQCVDWAFAGTSRTIKDAKSGDGVGSRSHTVWNHWIDSKDDDAPSDEGDMTVQEDGTILEDGVNVDPKSGKETKYEELWRDVPVNSLGKKHNKHSIVLRAEDSKQNLKGLIIKIGSWCQGILQKDGQLTIERWHQEAQANQNAETASNDPMRSRNDWVRTFKVGTETLYCEDVCEHTNGKLGMNRAHIRNDIHWRVIEEYYW